ncbi:MAG: D-alanyl-D-alanine carboxypeptidase (penicillin-binding protein 5/6) [Bacillota bacterium]|nr:MAG: D-alanyl-D-alanine carboxypeptidase (penicillin-binding protein 5/6) [Bacillota bacterium]MBS3950358.1 D-alanyl-D-alanine carboxypeptidase [Peptococcaceae bacterium]
MPKTILRAVALALCFVLTTSTFAYCSQPSLPALALEESLKSPSVILMDAGTGTILLEKNEHEPRAIASITKVMTMLLVLEAIADEKISWDDKVRTSSHARSYGGSQIWLEEGETLTVEELFLAVAVVSANDCAVALAEFVAGSEEGFVAMMNERAGQLGMQNTKFTNACGLDIDDPYSSAYDVVLMSRELIRHEKIFDFSTIRVTALERAKLTSNLTSPNRELLASYSGYDGLKTGKTTKSMWCLSSTAKRGDLRLIAVVLGAATTTDRRSDIVRLLDYGFANFEGRRIFTEGQEIGTTEVSKGKHPKVKAIVKDDLDILTPKGTKGKLEQKTDWLPLTAPLHVGQKVGTLTVLRDGNDIGCVDLLAAENVERAPLWLHFARLWERLLR